MPRTVSVIAPSDDAVAAATTPYVLFAPGSLDPESAVAERMYAFAEAYDVDVVVPCAVGSARAYREAGTLAQIAARDPRAAVELAEALPAALLFRRAFLLDHGVRFGDPSDSSDPSNPSDPSAGSPTDANDPARSNDSGDSDDSARSSGRQRRRRRRRRSGRDRAEAAQTERDHRLGLRTERFVQRAFLAGARIAWYADPAGAFGPDELARADGSTGAALIASLPLADLTIRLDALDGILAELDDPSIDAGAREALRTAWYRAEILGALDAPFLAMPETERRSRWTAVRDLAANRFDDALPTPLEPAELLRAYLIAARRYDTYRLLVERDQRIRPTARLDGATVREALPRRAASGRADVRLRLSGELDRRDDPAFVRVDGSTMLTIPAEAEPALPDDVLGYADVTDVPDTGTVEVLARRRSDGAEYVLPAGAELAYLPVQGGGDARRLAWTATLHLDGRVPGPGDWDLVARVEACGWRTTLPIRVDRPAALPEGIGEGEARFELLADEGTLALRLGDEPAKNPERPTPEPATLGNPTGLDDSATPDDSTELDEGTASIPTPTPEPSRVVTANGGPWIAARWSPRPTDVRVVHRDRRLHLALDVPLLTEPAPTGRPAHPRIAATATGYTLVLDAYDDALEVPASLRPGPGPIGVLAASIPYDRMQVPGHYALSLRTPDRDPVALGLDVAVEPDGGSFVAPSPSVSVVAVVRPGAPLDSLVESVQRQSLSTVELEAIVVVPDSGASTPSVEVLDELAVHNGHLQVVHVASGLSLGAARNIGLERARGTYVCLVDADDTLGDEALERLRGCAETYGSDLVLGSVVGTGVGHCEELFAESRADATLLDTPLEQCPGARMMLRRDVLQDWKLRFAEEGGPFDDELFALEAYLAADRVSVLADYPCFRAGRVGAGSAGSEPAAMAGRERFRLVRPVLRTLDRWDVEAADAGADAERRRRVRERVVRHLVPAITAYVRGEAYLRLDEDDREALVGELRTLLEEYLPTASTAGLPGIERVVLGLTRAGRRADLDRLARFEIDLTAVSSLPGLQWYEDGLFVVVEAGLAVGDSWVGYAGRPGDAAAPPVPALPVSDTGRELAAAALADRIDPAVRLVLTELGGTTERTFQAEVDPSFVALDAPASASTAPAGDSAADRSGARSSSGDTRLSLYASASVPLLADPSLVPPGLWALAVRVQAYGWSRDTPLHARHDDLPGGDEGAATPGARIAEGLFPVALLVEPDSPPQLIRVPAPVRRSRRFRYAASRFVRRLLGRP